MVYYKNDNEADTMLDVYVRYLSTDENISDIARDCDTSEQYLRQKLRQWCSKEEWDEAKKNKVEKRVSFENAQLSRIVKMNRTKAEARVESDEPIPIKEMCMIEKTFGDREAIASGKATETIEHKGTVTIVKFNDDLGG